MSENNTKLSWSTRTKAADKEGYRHAEYLWITVYYRHICLELESVFGALVSVLKRHSVANDRSMIYALKIPSKYENKIVTANSLEKIYRGQKRCCVGDIFNDEYGFTKKPRNTKCLEFSHSDNLRLHNAPAVRCGSFVLRYGRGWSENSMVMSRSLNSQEYEKDGDSYVQIGLRTSGLYGLDGVARYARDYVYECLQTLFQFNKPYHAIVHCDHDLQCDRGMSYVTEQCGISQCGLQNYINNERWCGLSCAERASSILGMYWGAYLSPAHLNRMGGKDRFVSDLLASGTGVYSQASDILRLQDGLFVSATPSPVQYSTEHQILIFDSAATYLYQKYREAGLL